MAITKPMNPKLEKLMESKKDSVDYKSLKEKKKIEFIVNLIDENIDEYKTLLPSTVKENQVYDSIYYIIVESLNGFDHNNKLDFFDKEHIENVIPIKLGWVKYKFRNVDEENLFKNGECVPHIPKYSEKGLLIINSYRSIKHIGEEHPVHLQDRLE